MITIDNRIRVPLSEVEDVEALKSAFTYKNPAAAKWKSLRLRGAPPPAELHSWHVQQGPAEDGERYLTFDHFSAPLGGLRRVQDATSMLRIDDRRVLGREDLAGRIPAHVVKPRDYQLAMQDAAIAKSNGCYRAPQGSGKTTAGLGLAARLNLPTLVLVWTTGLLKQWVERCRKELGIEPGVIQGSRRDVRPITIGMVQTLRTCAHEYSKTFGLVLADEVHFFAAPTFNDVIDVFESKYRIGLSADERRADGKEFLIYDAFGGVIAEVQRAALVQQRQVLDAEIRIVPTDFEAPWYAPAIKHAAVRRKPIVEFTDRLAYELANSETRAALVERIAKAHIDEGSRVVVLADRVEQCVGVSSALTRASGGRSGLALGGSDNAAEYDRAVRGLRDGSVVAAAATFKAFGTGIDVPMLDVGIFASPVANSPKGEMQFGQYRGRFERAPDGKRGAVVYYLWDRSIFGEKPVRNLARWNANVVVQDGEDWIPVREFLKRGRGRGRSNATTKRRDDGAPGATAPEATSEAGGGPARRLRSTAGR